MSGSLPPPEPGRARRRADRPTAARAARASIRDAARGLVLLAGEPGRRRRRHRARVALGATVAGQLAGQPAPAFLASPLAAHRTAQLRLASTEVAPRDRRASEAAEAGSRAGRSARRDRDVMAEVERLLLVVVQFLPRVAALVRLRAAEARLGAWSAGLTELHDPAVVAARERLAAAQLHVAEAAAAMAASRRGTLASAQTALTLTAEALAAAAAWLGRGLRAASGVLWAWLLWLAAAGRRAVRAAAAGVAVAAAAAVAAVQAAAPRVAAAGRAAAHGTAAAAAVAARAAAAVVVAVARVVARAVAAAARTAGAAVVAATRAVAAATLAVARTAAAAVRTAAAAVRTTAAAGLAAAHGVAAWIDGRVARGRARRRRGRRIPAAEPARADPAGGPNGRVEGAGASTAPLLQGGPDGPGRERPPGRDDQQEATEPWWLPSHLGEPVADGTGRRTRRRRAGAYQRRNSVVAGLTALFRRAARRLGRVVVALAAPPDHRRRGWLPFVRPVAVALALALVAGTAAALPTGMLVAGSVKVAAAGLPDLDELKKLRQPERTQIYDRDGRLIEVLHDEQDRIVVPLTRMAKRLQQAVIAAEDARFYEHGGVDERGIVRAALANMLKGDVTQGGSTITQQLVRNTYPDLRARTLDRKVKEAALAAQLENRLSKREILAAYLNRVYFGAGYYGVETASWGYFRRHAREVSLTQAATLAAIIREPETANPRQHPERARALRDSVLTRMADLGMVAATDAAKARARPLKVRGPRTVGGRYPWFVDGLRRQLEHDGRLGKSREQRVRRLFEGGLRIRTTLDRDLQLAAEQAVRNHLPESGRQQIALIAIDPRNGAVRAVVGGQNYRRNHYNVAVQGRGRQPGSSFKPFVLATALDAGVAPDSVWESSGFSSDDVCGAPWTVDNYEGKGSGKISVREATWRSVNGVYARLMEHLCPAKVAAMADKLGVHLEGPQAHAPSMALGSVEVRPIDMASAYGVFANLGEYHRPTFVERVTYRSDTVLENRPHGERRISAALAWQVNDILKGVIAHGTGTAASIGRPEAGKTGTNQEYRDAWFVGYTPQLVTAVWMGDPKEQTPMLNVGGIRVTGGSYPAQVWRDFMLAAMVNQEVLDWPKPPEELSYTILPPPPSQPKQEPGKKKRRKHPGPPGGR
jgi:penicillin-binding protein 1A